MTYGPGRVVPFSFDLSTLVQRSVASLYSHLVTRPTGRALRLGIESQIIDLGACCISVLDFTQVVVLDYSCADEAVAKLIQRFQNADRPADAYFVARGLGEQHRDPIEAVLVRHGLALVAEIRPAGFTLLGRTTAAERTVWDALERDTSAVAATVARRAGLSETETATVLHDLAERRLVLVIGTPPRFHALSALLQSA